MTDETDDGIKTLQEAIALGDSPYLEESHFYLAKAYLQQGDTAAAREELKVLIELGGQFADSARQLDRDIRALTEQ